MKQGFQIYIQADLNEDEKLKAIGHARNFIAQTCADPKFRYFGMQGGGYTTGIWRGRHGLDFGGNLVFRRISTNTRKFGIVKSDTMEVHNDSFLDKHHKSYRDLYPDGPIPAGCACPRHKASLKVRWKNNKEPKLELYAQVGEYKG